MRIFRFKLITRQDEPYVWRTKPEFLLEENGVIQERSITPLPVCHVFIACALDMIRDATVETYKGSIQVLPQAVPPLDPEFPKEITLSFCDTEVTAKGWHPFTLYSELEAPGEYAYYVGSDMLKGKRFQEMMNTDIWEIYKNGNAHELSTPITPVFGRMGEFISDWFGEEKLFWVKVDGQKNP
jgi:hypothetical protein